MSNDDLSDIDPKLVEAVLAHADDFIAVDNRADKIIEWAAAELEKEEQKINNGDGTVADFKKAAVEIEAQAAQKLKDLETETRTKFATPES